MFDHEEGEKIADLTTSLKAFSSNVTDAQIHQRI
jgi:hypothetical protein